jgi:hypothetical protein
MKKAYPFLIVCLLMVGIAGAGLAGAAPDSPLDDGDDLSFRGIVDSMPPDRLGAWVVSGESFTATASTEFDTEDGDFVLGGCVEVDYVWQDEVRLATEIDTKASHDCDDDDDDHATQTYGRVYSFPADLVGSWVIDGVSYTATSQTEFEQEDGVFGVGVCVEVKYDPATNDAYEIETEDDYECDGDDQEPSNLRQTYGIVVNFPADLIGEWVVDETTYMTTAVTEFEEDDGPFFIGGCVEVKYDPNDNNTVYELETSDSDDCGDDDDDDSNDPERKAFGLLESRPEGTQLGEWIIGGQRYQANDQTEFDNDDDGEFVVGACLSVEYIVTDAGNIAREIEVEELYKCQNGTAANRYSGTLESFPASLYGVWVIDGFMFTTDAATEFDDDDETYVVGNCIKVKYVTRDGINKVIELEKDDDCDGDDDQDGAYNKLYATLDSFPSELIGAWGIGGQTFTATAVTEFEQEDDGPFAVGKCVSAEYDQQLLLHEVETEDDYKCRDEQNATVFKLYGTVSQLPLDPFIGQWLIAGQTIQATASTEFQQEYGLFGVGVFVEVKYVLDGDTAVALEIETHVAPDAGLQGDFGLLNNFDDTDAWQNWVISGQTYQADPALDIDRQPQVNGRVFYRSYTALDGQQYLSSITATTDNFLPLLVSP